MSSAAITGCAVLLPAIGALFVGLLKDRPNPREAVSLITAGLLFGLVASLFPAVSAGERPALTLVEVLPGLLLAFEVEPLGLE